MTRLVAAALAVLAIGMIATASDARTAARAGVSWIVLSSDRDGTERAYSVRQDGSRLTPLVAPGRVLVPLTVSGDGGTIAYTDARSSAIYVSRADGKNVRRVVRGGTSPALSDDGKRLAVALGKRPYIAVVGTDGRGLRRLTSGYDGAPSWSPDAKALVFHRSVGAPKKLDEDAVVVKPLRGKPRILARGGGLGAPLWSPDGRWIAYQRSQGPRVGLYLVRPNGRGLHRVATGYTSAFAWSPDGSRLAVGIEDLKVMIVRTDGRVVMLVRLRLTSTMRMIAWSLNGLRLAVGAGSDERGEIWVVDVRGRGLHRVVSRGNSFLTGWAGLAPARPQAPPLPPTEHVVAATTVATRAPVIDLSADGDRAAFAVASTPVDCGHVAVWAPEKKRLDRFGRPVNCGDGNSAGAVYDVELAGSRAAWTAIISCGNYCEVKVQSATLARRAPVALASDAFNANDTGSDFHLHGNGELLVFNDDTRLVQIGIGTENCVERGDYNARICTTLRRGRHAYVADSASAGRVAVLEPDAVAVVDAQGSLVRVFPFGPNDVDAAKLDGERLVIARPGLIEVYDVATGAGVLQQPLPSGYALDAVDGGVALLRRGGSVMLLRLADGRSFTFTPGRGPVSADLEPPGLYYSYATAAGGGRVVFMPRLEVEQKLGG
jgi:WD40 repeat protein